jgi:superfamily II DNA/RNA helicase
VAQAEGLTKEADPKLESVAKLLKPLIANGARPVVFCRFIATADHVAQALRKVFPKLRIEAVTGELTPEERRARVDGMAEAEQRLLVATDCLSGPGARLHWSTRWIGGNEHLAAHAGHDEARRERRRGPGQP